MTATWRVCPSWPLYEANQFGEIRVVKTAHVLCQRFDRSGYLVVTLTRNGKRTRFRVHQLVTNAHFGPRPSGMEVRHLSGIKSDNSIANLRYGTPQENYADRRLHGTDNAGSRNGRALLSKEVAELVRVAPVSASVAARLLGVSRAAIRDIRLGLNWK